MRVDRERWALALALGALGLLAWLARDPLFARGDQHPASGPGATAALAAVPAAPPGGGPAAPIGASTSAAAPAPGAAQVPVVFLPNAGQADARVRFLAPGARGTLWFTEREVVLGLSAPAAPAEERIAFRGG